MAKSKLKITGFARFFLVMLILAPAAYIGASYANGEDGIENFKNLFQGKISTGEQKTQSAPAEASDTKTVEIPASTSTSTPQSSGLDAEVFAQQTKKIQILEETNKELKAELYQKAKDIEELKAELEALKNEE